MGLNRGSSHYELRTPNNCENLLKIDENNIEYPWIQIPSTDYKVN